MSNPHLLRNGSALILMFFLASPNLVALPRRLKHRKLPAHIVFSHSDLAMNAGQAITVTAKVLDGLQTPIDRAIIEWKLPREAQNLLQLQSLDRTGSQILLTAHSDIPASRTVVLQARSGRISRPLSVTLQSPKPAQILIKEGRKVTLTVGGKETLHAYVLDQRGNRIKGSPVKWRLARQADEAFVYLGAITNDADTNSIEIVWRPGTPDREAPSEVQLHAIVDNVLETITIEYKSPPAEENKITFDPKVDLLIQPGGTATVKVTVSAKNNQTLDTKITAEIIDENASKLIKVTGPDKEKKLTLIGLNADAKTPDVVKGLLVVKSAGVSAALPITYRKDLVSTFWEILPPRIVGDNYGRTIKNDYYCIEVTVRNTSGSDIALAALAFELNGRARPVTSYTTVHGSLAKRKLTHPRALTLAILDGVGSLMTGFNPFFHNDSHAANYSQFIDIVSNPLAKGAATVWRDSYPDEVARFETDVLKDDKIISNGGIFKTKVFFPKRVLFGNKDKNREDLDKVREKLGRLVLMGHRLGPIENFSQTP